MSSQEATPPRPGHRGGGHFYTLLPTDRGSLRSHSSYLSITPVGCDGKMGEGLAAASRSALLHFGRGIKSAGAILVLTAGPCCTRARGSVHVWDRADLL